MARVKYQSSPIADALDKALDMIYTSSIQQKQMEFQRENRMIDYKLRELSQLEQYSMGLDEKMAQLGVIDTNLNKIDDSLKTSGSQELLTGEKNNAMNAQFNVVQEVNKKRDEINQSLDIIGKLNRGRNIKSKLDLDADTIVSEEEFLNASEDDMQLLNDPHVKTGYDYTDPKETAAARRFKIQQEQFNLQARGATINEQKILREMQTKYGATLHQGDSWEGFLTGASDILTNMQIGLYSKYETMSESDLLELAQMDEKDYIDGAPGRFSFHNVDALKEEIRKDAINELIAEGGMGINPDGIKVEKDEIDAYQADSTISSNMEDFINRYTTVAMSGLKANDNYLIQNESKLQGYNQQTLARFSEFAKLKDAKLKEISSLFENRLDFGDESAIKEAKNRIWKDIKGSKDSKHYFDEWDKYEKVFNQLMKSYKSPDFILSVAMKPEYMAIINRLPEAGLLYQQMANIAQEAGQYITKLPESQLIKSEQREAKEAKFFDWMEGK